MYFIDQPALITHVAALSLWLLLPKTFSNTCFRLSWKERSGHILNNSYLDGDLNIWQSGRWASMLALVLLLPHHLGSRRQIKRPVCAAHSQNPSTAGHQNDMISVCRTWNLSTTGHENDKTRKTVSWLNITWENYQQECLQHAFYNSWTHIWMLASDQEFVQCVGDLLLWYTAEDGALMEVSCVQSKHFYCLKVIGHCKDICFVKVTSTN